jgi:hypothetical protein
MYEKLRIHISILLPMVIFMTGPIVLKNNAVEPVVTYSGPQITHDLKAATIDRVGALEKFFEKYNSPLKGHANTFVEVADKYGIEYTLLPAISCMESSCGKKMLPNTYNPFGWGIYGNNFIAFNDFDEAIETVGKGLNENYFARGFDTPQKIAPIYTPPNHVNWLRGVNFFVGQINKAEVSNSILLASNLEMR